MKLHSLALVLLAISLPALAAEDMPIKNQQSKQFKGRSVREVEINYLLFLPEGYAVDAAKKWPLMMFLHGAGERGTNLAKLTVHGPPKIVKERADFPFILVSPQCPAGETWDDATLLALLDQVIEEHRVDARRVYLTGLSMGGFGTWSLGIKHPGRFAAIAPICGGGEILSILLAPKRNETALKKLPIWAFHGAKDEVVRLEESERMANAVKRLGNPNVKLTVYPEAGHDSWTEAYNNQELYDWFLSHALPAKAGAGRTAPNSPVRAVASKR